MQAGRASRTAEHNALFRALEVARPAAQRVVHDELAPCFLGIPYRLVALLARNPALASLVCRTIDHRWPGSRTALVARTRLIDEHLCALLARGANQVVILGAGFDSRAYRPPGAERAQFFEADHPSTLTLKRSRVRRAIGTLPRHVHYVPVDFQRDSLPKPLHAAGFDARQQSVFIWEGVSNYLTGDAVRATLKLIGGMAEGTVLIFTYVDEAVIHHPASFIGGAEVQKTIARIREPWTFGVQPQRAAALFNSCGLHLDTDLSAAEYRRRYYGADTPIRGYEFYHVVTAHVPGQAPQVLPERASEVPNA